MRSVLSATQSTLRPTLVGQARSSVWGEGFADDGFSVLASVRSLDDICADEFVRLFPQLVGRPGKEIVHQLGINLRLIAPEHVEIESTSSAEIRLLEQLLRCLREGRATSYEPAIADAVAYHCAIHPAYFWAEAMPLHQRYSTLGWLGIVLRGRPALMPVDVAEYLRDAIGADGRIAPQEPLFSRITSWQAAQRLRGKAMLRLEGHRITVSPGSLRTRWPSVLKRCRK